MEMDAHISIHACFFIFQANPARTLHTESGVNKRFPGHETKIRTNFPATLDSTV